MAPPDPDLGTGLIIIRLWRSADSPSRLRAQLTFKPEVDAEESLSAAAATVEALCGQVWAWADFFLTPIER